MQSVAVYTGQLQASACACASALDFSDVNIRDDPSRQLLATLQLHTTAAALLSAAACVLASCVTPLQSAAVYTGGGGAGQLQRLACACASARETFEVNVSDDPSGQLLVTLHRHFTFAAKTFAAARVAASCVTPLQSVAEYTGQLQASACACASAGPIRDVKLLDDPSGQLLVTLQVGQLQRSAWACAADCETVEVNFLLPLGQDL